MDRYWFFTWRTYGTWLPGESGFVGQYVNEAGRRVIDNADGQPTAEPMPRLAEYARIHGRAQIGRDALAQPAHQVEPRSHHYRPEQRDPEQQQKVAADVRIGSGSPRWDGAFDESQIDLSPDHVDHLHGMPELLARALGR